MMKLLLDEQLPKSIANEIPAPIEVHSVQSQGWGGVKNGALLKLAHENGFTALLSADKNIASQHNEKQLLIPVVILSVLRLHADNLIPLIPKAISELEADASPRFIVVKS
jgi:hypothetical protein